MAQTLRAITSPRLYDARRHLWRRAPTRFGGLVGRRAYDHLWPYANAWSALCAAASVPGGPTQAAELASRFPSGVRAYAGPGAPARGYQAAVVPPLGPGGDRYYDDNAWLGLAMLRHTQLTGDELVLQTARGVLAFVVSGWSAEPAAHPGGVRWRDTARSRTRHACSTAPAVQLAVALGTTRGEEQLVSWAVAAYAWTRRALLGDDGLYADRISPEGRVERTRWTYNQGAMIGAGVQLAAATGEGAYLRDAVQSAEAALAHFDLERLVSQAPRFNAIYFRNLFFLAASDAVLAERVRSGTRAYSDAVWSRRRDDRSGLFTGGRSALNATVPMLEIDALLAGAPGMG